MRFHLFFLHAVQILLAQKMNQATDNFSCNLEDNHALWYVPRSDFDPSGSENGGSEIESMSENGSSIELERRRESTNVNTDPAIPPITSGSGVQIDTEPASSSLLLSTWSCFYLRLSCTCSSQKPTALPTRWEVLCSVTMLKFLTGHLSTSQASRYFLLCFFWSVSMPGLMLPCIRSCTLLLEPPVFRCGTPQNHCRLILSCLHFADNVHYNPRDPEQAALLKVRRWVWTFHIWTLLWHFALPVSISYCE